MPLNSQSQRRLLLTFILSIAACGLLGAYVLVRGSTTRLEESILVSILVIGGASILGLCSAMPWEQRRWHPLGPIAALSVVLAAVISIYSIWQDFAEWRGFQLPGVSWRITFAAWIVAVAAPLVAMLSLANLDRNYRRIREYTVAVIIVLSGLIIYLIWDEPSSREAELIIRTAGVLGIAVVCGILAVPILHRMTTIKRRESVRTTELSLTVSCPRCNYSQTLPVGRSACAKCKLRFTIDIEENNCPQCGYALYKLESASCPECGTRVTSL